MILDSGLAIICNLANVHEPPKMPKEALVEIPRGFYGIRTIGVSRYYQAAGADREIDMLIRMHWDPAIKAGLYVVLDETNEQFRIDRIQQVEDSDSFLRMWELTLVRLGNRYDVAREIA